MELLTAGQVAEQLGVPVATVQYWRTKKTGPDYMKIGRYVRYSAEAVKAFVERQTVTTSKSQEVN